MQIGQKDIRFLLQRVEVVGLCNPQGTTIYSALLLVFETICDFYKFKEDLLFWTLEQRRLLLTDIFFFIRRTQAQFAFLL